MTGDCSMESSLSLRGLSGPGWAEDGRGPRVIGRKASSGLGCCLTCDSSNFGNGKRTERGGARDTGILPDKSSFLMGSLGRTGILARPGRPGIDILGIPPAKGFMGGGARLGKGVRSESLGRPGRPMGGLVPGGMIGSILR